MTASMRMATHQMASHVATSMNVYRSTFVTAMRHVPTMPGLIHVHATRDIPEVEKHVTILTNVTVRLH